MITDLIKCRYCEFTLKEPLGCFDIASLKDHIFDKHKDIITERCILYED